MSNPFFFFLFSCVCSIGINDIVGRDVYIIRPLYAEQFNTSDHSDLGGGGGVFSFELCKSLICIQNSSRAVCRSFFFICLYSSQQKKSTFPMCCTCVDIRRDERINPLLQFYNTSMCYIITFIIDIDNNSKQKLCRPTTAN